MSTRRPSRLARYVSVRQVADAWDMSQQTIRGLIADGTLPAVYIGKTVRIPLEATQELPTPAGPNQPTR